MPKFKFYEISLERRGDSDKQKFIDIKNVCNKYCYFFVYVVKVPLDTFLFVRQMHHGLEVFLF